MKFEDVLLSNLNSDELRIDKVFSGKTLLDLLAESGFDFGRQAHLSHLMQNFVDVIGVMNTMGNCYFLTLFLFLISLNFSCYRIVL